MAMLPAHLRAYKGLAVISAAVYEAGVRRLHRECLTRWTLGRESQSEAGDCGYERDR